MVSPSACSKGPDGKVIVFVNICHWVINLSIYCLTLGIVRDRFLTGIVTTMHEREGFHVDNVDMM